MSNCTASLRFPGISNNADMRKLSTNLVPFPRLHFLMQSQAPLLKRTNHVFEKLNVQNIASQMFDSRSLLSNAGDISMHGKILTASCLFRGKNLSALEVE
jgi:tubulin beta